MEREISLESRKYNIITQITNFENENIIEKIEDFLYLLNLQKLYDNRLYNSGNDDDSPSNLFIEHKIN
jgi:hypothetical protein